MTVLLMTKPSNYELHADNVRRAVAKGYADKQELTSLEFSHKQHYDCDAKLKLLLKANGIDFICLNRNSAWPKSKIDFVITVGGDGTLLSAAQFINDSTPILGICSTDTSIGFLCGIRSDGIEKFLSDFVQQKVPLQQRSRMAVDIQTYDNRKINIPGPVLNDFLFSAQHPAATSRYQISLNNKSEDQRSSGVWIATASGSSAAIRGAGGKSLPFESDQAQFCVREIYQTHAKMFIKGECFDPYNDELSIKVNMMKAQLSFDGQRSAVQLEYGDKLIFKAASKVRLVKYKTS